MKLTKFAVLDWLSALLLLLIVLSMLVYDVFYTSFLSPSVTYFIGCIGVLAVFIFLYFFRDPNRTLFRDSRKILAPADGVIQDVELIKNESFPIEEVRNLFHGRDMLRIGIDQSALQVHIDRVPVNMIVDFRIYKKGRIFTAKDGKTVKENESMLLGGHVKPDNKTDCTFPILLRQISGGTGHRIVCRPRPGDVLTQGCRYGMIKFGYRMEVYLPAGVDFKMENSNGCRVTAGQTALTSITDDTLEEIKKINAERTA